MKQRFLVFSATVLLLSAAAFAQNPISADSPFQVRYASNLNIGDSVVNLTNTCASGGPISVSVYTHDPAEELISCCCCVVTCDGLASLSVRNSLISNNLTPEIPNAVVIKFIARVGACNAAVPGTLAPGLAAWGTTLHALPTTPVTYGVAETAFTPSTVGAVEYLRITQVCGFIQSNGSGFGICKGCASGGLGAVTAQ